MKRIALSLLAVLALGAPAKAIVGGPFDNNLFYSPTVDGTFQGTLSGKNISAVMVFSVGASAPISSTTGSTDARFPNVGKMVSFYRGGTALSYMDAVADGNSRNIAAVITGESELLIQGFMSAKFDNIYPSITYKGKADMSAYWEDVVNPSNSFYEEFSARVRGIKTANTPSAGYWLWN